MKNGKASAGQRRKPRGPTIEHKNLQEIKDTDRELLQLAYRLKNFEELRRKRELNTPFIALETLSALAGGKVAGRTEEALRRCWPEEWGTETISVPLSLLLALRDGWCAYMAAPSGKSLGEALKIEGGGQGRKPMKARLKAIDQTRELACAVEGRYLQIEGASDEMTLNDVFSEVAAEHGVSFQKVKEAHKAHRPAIREELRVLGVLGE